MNFLAKKISWNIIIIRYHIMYLGNVNDYCLMITGHTNYFIIYKNSYKII